MKHTLKQSVLKQRNSLTKEEILEISSIIESKLFNLEIFKKSRAIMFFVSINSEVHTHEMIKKTLGSKTVIVPKVLHHEIEPSMIIDFDNLIPSEKYGILEPIDVMKIAYKNIDLILVPGIAFDKEGNRIGYGFGYYDKFLARVPKAIKIGLCFDLQIVDKIPKEEHDVPVDIIITEKRVIECKKI